jgi:hypothetical protein
MDSIINSTTLATVLQALQHSGLTFWATSGLALVAIATFASWLTSKEPPSLWDNIPFVSNTLQFLTNNELFMKRVM